MLSRLDEIVPVVHARFSGASMAQKYGGLMGDTSEPFVLGGNPLLVAYRAGGDAAVDAIVGSPGDWAKGGFQAMLRELAIDIVTSGVDGDADDRQVGGAHDVDDDDVEADDRTVAGDDVGFGNQGDDEDDEAPVAASEEDHTDDDDEDEDDDDDEDEGDEDGEGDDDSEGAADRYVASFAGELLAARAAAGKLEPRAGARLVAALAVGDRYEHRRTSIAHVLGALQYQPAVPALIDILGTVHGREHADDRQRKTSSSAPRPPSAPSVIPAAILALVHVVTVAGDHNDKPRLPPPTRSRPASARRHRRTMSMTPCSRRSSASRPRAASRPPRPSSRSPGSRTAYRPRVARRPPSYRGGRARSR